MKQIVKKIKRAVTEMLLLTLVSLCFTGCKKQENDGLETVLLQQQETEEEYTGEAREQQESDESADAGQQAEAEGQKTIVVYVCGAVHMPGVYELENGARVYEAVLQAGGVREDAAEEYVNQAQMVSDGEQIYIPTEEEVQQGNAEVFPGPVKAADSPASSVDDYKVNINTASEEELKTLTGIGDVRAKSIVEYRRINGSFQTIEDLMKVDGIKEGVFEKIKDRITVRTGS